MANEVRTRATDTPGFGRLWRWALWFALTAALAQVAVMAGASWFSDRLIQPVAELVYIVPVTDAVAFSLAALLLWMAARLWARAGFVIPLAVYLFLWILGPALMVKRIHEYALLVLTAGVAIQGARFLNGRLDRAEAAMRRTLPALVVVTLGLAAGLPALRAWQTAREEASLPAPPPGAPNVLLVVLDTVRASSLHLYGYDRPTSPKLDAFARSGVVFDRALSTSPWTLPSHSAMFTGRQPYELSAGWLTPLDDAYPTLAETLAGRGYTTIGVVANLLYATKGSGLARGFVRYWDFPLTTATFARRSWLTRGIVQMALRLDDADEVHIVRKRSDVVTDEFLSWVRDRPDRPFFAFLNYFDAHAPYLPEPPFDTKFGPGGPLPDPDTRREWTAEEIQRSQDAYDGAVAQVDAEVGRLLDGLRADGVLDDTVVIVTSDHGEQFGEHRLFDHANSLYRPVLQVPLVISFPGTIPAGTHVTEAVSLVDLPATILDLVGLPQTPLPGESLATTWSDGDQPQPEDPVFASVRRGINLGPWQPVSRGDMYSVLLRGFHYIRGGDGAEELFDFERDPDELTNLVNQTGMAGLLAEARRLTVAVPHR